MTLQIDWNYLIQKDLKMCFHYQFYLLMNTVGRTEEAKRSLQKLEGVIEGIRPEIKAVNIDNLKQSAK